MTGRELYEIWAPQWDEWSPWVKPVLFTEIEDVALPVTAPAMPAESDLHCSAGFRRDTALVLDLPGLQSLMAAFSLAKDGYRPVPLFNTTSGRRQRVPPSKCVLASVPAMVQVLSAPPPEYVRNAIIGDNPPAFLLDSYRLSPDNRPAPGMYDNRWIAFPQDFPSAAFLKSRGITQVIVIQEGYGSPADDLAHVLRRWQEAGISLFVQEASEASSLRPIDVQRPSGFRSMIYRVLVLMKLRRNSAGGFGSVIPIPGEGGHGFG
jgi:hypothetical protein